MDVFSLSQKDLREEKMKTSCTQTSSRSSPSSRTCAAAAAKIQRNVDN